jgi:hypothetical protein
LSGPCCDQGQARIVCAASLRVFPQKWIRGKIFMKSIRPDNPDPIPLRSEPPRIGTIMIQFVGLLVVAVVALALVRSR